MFLSGSSTEFEEITADTVTVGENGFLAASGSVLVVTGKKFTLGEDNVFTPETGLYVWFDHRSLDSYVARVSWGQLRFLRLDDRFIPLSVARKGEVGFLLGSQGAQILMTLLRDASYTTEQTGNLDSLAQMLGVEGNASGSAAITLTGITAVYTGGDVPAGTHLTDLMGLSVWASYADGSEEPIYSYTLSGDIREGSNTITVIYQGKTDTFTVTGTGKSQSGDAPVGWPVTLILSGCTADWQNSYAAGGLPLAVRLTADGDHTLDGALVKVTMGGVDITAYSYAGGMITIGAVTGEVEIMAEASAL